MPTVFLFTALWGGQTGRLTLVALPPQHGMYMGVRLADGERNRSSSRT